MTSGHSGGKQLERVLGLPAALSIGMGTMMGAGVFLFPGLAGARAGPAAVLSFALGGGIALLVAACTAELATAMPKSGGAYQFASKAFGPLGGAVVGSGQWMGLVFASAFYLVGFGRYATDLLAEVGVSLADSAVLIALGTALVLTAINLVGADVAGRLQSIIVVVLTSILALLFGYGVLRSTGLVGETRWPTPFAPHGPVSVLKTTALVFTSYLGFVQITTVAGEVKEPKRTLPLALVGSVLIVATVYVAVMFVSTSQLSIERLEALGEVAVIEVAGSLVGRAGALAITGAGLLATVSSANASVLSSSRTLYALGRDGLIPSSAGRVNAKFNTPHVALLAVGLPIAGLALFDRLEVLAEVASVLHLVIYGLICVALLVLRHRRPHGYAPTFEVPAGRFVAALGALASFGLIAFMGTLSLMLGAGVLVGALIGYAAYGRRHARA